MQDVTTLPFMRLLGKYGAPDLLFTEYFRVHGHSTLEQHIVDSICHHNTGRPVFAQLIGESLPDIERTVTAIEKAELPVAGIDLNMGCPAPKVYKKNVGGGLLREPSKVDEVLGCLRAAVKGRFTVKMRIGFDCDEHFEEILKLIEKHRVDLLSLHARTVKEAYRSEVHYEYIKRAAERATCPVLANGNITSVAKGQWVLDGTKAAVRQYVDDLVMATSRPDLNGQHHINHMKKFLNFVGLGVDVDGQFLHDMRRAKTKDELDAICDRHLIDKGRAEQPFPDEPIKGLVARPNCETSRGCAW
jgi:tRNA-dihydrouridine synthase